MSKGILSKEMIGELSRVGITNVKTEQEAKSILLEKLAEHELRGFEDEKLIDLIQLYEPFMESEEIDEVSTSNEAIEEEVPSSEEEEYDELGEEMKEEAEKKQKEIQRSTLKSAKEPKVKREKTSETIQNKMKNGNTRFCSFIEVNKEKVVNEEHVEILQKFRKKFPEEKYDIHLLKNGFSIKQILKSKKKVILSYDKLVLNDKQEIVGGLLFFDCLKGIEEVNKYIKKGLLDDKKIRNYTTNLVTASPVSFEEFNEIISDDFVEFIDERMTSFDSKLEKNRKRLEDRMKETVPAKKVVIEEKPKKKLIILKKK